LRAEQLLHEGDIQGSLQDIQEQIRKQPENAEYRVFLFQLLAILGQWERALNQLNVLGELKTDAWPITHLYRGAVHCEVFRQEVFAGRRKPLIFGEPPPWMVLLLESLRLINEGHHHQAITIRNQAFEQAAESTGHINEQPFSWIADADTRLGPVLEIILNGRYYWAPFTQLSALSSNKPEDLRDLVWLPAQFTWVNGGQAYGLLPARYPGSELSTDPAIQMAKKTEWQEIAEGIHQGCGQRMLATDQDEYPLLEIRSIYFK
jgi:type VI secretion system protein ImpE